MYKYITMYINAYIWTYKRMNVHISFYSVEVVFLFKQTCMGRLEGYNGSNTQMLNRYPKRKCVFMH